MSTTTTTTTTTTTSSTSTSTILIDEKTNRSTTSNVFAGWLIWARGLVESLLLSSSSVSHSVLRSSRLQQLGDAPVTPGSQQLTLSTPRTITRRRPIPNSYWATPNLLACEYPWSPGSPRQKLDALLTIGIRTFIDLTEHGELLQYQSHLPSRAQTLGLSQSDVNSIEYHRFPIPDRTVPPSNSNIIHQILQVIRDCERRGRIAAVHCRGGIGRTGTVVGCWLVESGVARDGEEALRIIAEEWKTVEKCSRFPCSPETGPQCNFVRNYRKTLTTSSTTTMRTPTPLTHSLPTSDKACIEAQVENSTLAESIW